MKLDYRLPNCEDHYLYPDCFLRKIFKIAGDHVKHCWTDVCIHDANMFCDAQEGQTFIWVLKETGSHLNTLSCLLSTKNKSNSGKRTEEMFGYILSEWNDTVKAIYFIKMNAPNRQGQPDGEIQKVSKNWIKESILYFNQIWA